MDSHSPSQRKHARLVFYFASACILTLGVVAGVFALFGARQPEVGPEGRGADAEGLREQVQSLNREVALLRARQASTEERVRDPVDELLPQDGEADSSIDSASDESAPPTEETEEEVKAQAAARYEFLDSSFLSEPRDAAWSETTESEIAAAFESEALSGAQLQSASCGSTMCKVEMSLGSVSEVGGFQEVFARTIRDSLPTGTMREVEGEDGKLKLVAYLARPDSRLPHWRSEN